MFKSGWIFKIALLSCLLTGCVSTVPPSEQPLNDENDPFEPVNRSVFSFNDTLEAEGNAPMDEEAGFGEEDMNMEMSRTDGQDE